MNDDSPACGEKPATRAIIGAVCGVVGWVIDGLYLVSDSLFNKRIDGEHVVHIGAGLFAVCLFAGWFAVESMWFEWHRPGRELAPVGLLMALSSFTYFVYLMY